MSLFHKWKKAEGLVSEKHAAQVPYLLGCLACTSCTCRSTRTLPDWLVSGCLHLRGQTGPWHGCGAEGGSQWQQQMEMYLVSPGTELFESLSQCSAGTATFPPASCRQAEHNPLWISLKTGCVVLCECSAPVQSIQRWQRKESRFSGGGWGFCFPIPLPHMQGREIHSSSSSLCQDQ